MVIMNENLIKSITEPMYLSADKFTDGEYWCIGLFHDAPGENFARAMCNYFEEQYRHCLRSKKEVLIDIVCEEYNTGLV